MRLLLGVLLSVGLLLAQITRDNVTGNQKIEGTVEVVPTVPGGQGGAYITPSAGVLDRGGQVYNVQAYGILPNGTDYSAQFIALLATAYTAGAATIYFPPSVAANKYRLDSCFTLPNNGAAVPTQPFIRITGAGASMDSAEIPTTAPFGGSTLDMRCTSGTAYFDTRGQGTLEIDHLAFVNGTNGVSPVPFIQTTNTIVRVHDNLFLGSLSVAGSTSTQDVIVLGGTTITIDGAATAPFQGYGTVIEKNHFNRIRRGVYLRTYANGVVIRDNTWWNLCGAADATTAALEFDGGPSVIVGADVSGNLFETYAYPSVIKLIKTLHATFFANNFYDASAGTLSLISFDANSYANIVYEGLSPSAPPTTQYPDLNGGNTIYGYRSIRGGNFGFGFTDPGDSLSVKGAPAVISGYNNTYTPGATVAFFSGTSYVKQGTSYGGMKVLLDPIQPFKGAVAFYVASVDGTDPTKHPTEKTRIDQNGNFGIGTTLPLGAPAARLTTKGSGIFYDPSALGAELATSDASCTGWTLAAGWTCSSGVITHTAGTGTAEYTPTITAGWILLLTFTATGRTVGSVTPSVGGTVGSADTVATAATYDIATTTTGNLVLTPTTDFNGSITVNGAGTLSLKQVLGGTLSAGGGSPLVVSCWKADGRTLGYATVAEITAGTCH